MANNRISTGLMVILFSANLVMFYYRYTQLTNDSLNVINTFKAYLRPTTNHHRPKLFFYNGNGWLEHSSLEGQHLEVSHNKKMLKTLSLKPKVILEADIPNSADINPTLFSRLSASLEKEQFSFGFSYASHRTELLFANPYTVVSGTRFFHPEGIPSHYDESHPSHYPQIVLLNKKHQFRMDMVQGILSCREQTQITNKDCLTYYKDYFEEVIVDNKHYVPTNPWFTAYSERMAPMMYLPESMDWSYAVIIRSYVAQAIFRLIGSYVGMSGTNLEIFSKNLPRMSAISSNHLESVAGALNFWVKTVQRNAAKNNQTTMGLNDLVVQAYKHLHADGHVSKEALNGAQEWISALQGLDYNQEETLVKGKVQFEDENQIMTKPLPIVGVFFMFDDFIHQSGLLHSIYQGIYKDMIFAVQPMDSHNPRLAVPLPAKTVFVYRPPGTYRVDINSYLGTVDQMERSSQAYEDVLIWQHDDMLVNLTFLHKFVQDKQAFAAGIPGIEGWKGSSGVETEVQRVADAKKNYTFHDTDDWLWTDDCQNSLKRMVDAEGYGFFHQNNSVCGVLDPLIKKQIPETYKVWSYIFFGQTDFFGSRWKHPRMKLFNKNLKRLFSYDVFHECAASLALRCTLTPEEIDRNYIAKNISLITWWDQRRNHLPSMREFVSKTSFDMIHPNKFANTEDHLRFALEYRALTLPRL